MNFLGSNYTLTGFYWLRSHALGPSEVFCLQESFKNFQGFSRIPCNSLKNSWKFKAFNPCLDLHLPWRCSPWHCLEIQGFSRSTWIFPWNIIVTLDLEKPWNFWKGQPWPWKNLEIQLQLQGTLKFKAMVALTTIVVVVTVQINSIFWKF